MATYRKTAKTIKKVLLPPSRRVNVNVTPSWICWAHIETTHDDHFVVSIGIAVQNLVEIDAVVCIL